MPEGHPNWHSAPVFKVSYNFAKQVPGGVLEYEPTRYTAKSIIYICLFDYFTYVESSPTTPQFITIN